MLRQDHFCRVMSAAKSEVRRTLGGTNLCKVMNYLIWVENYFLSLGFKQVIGREYIGVKRSREH